MVYSTPSGNIPRTIDTAEYPASVPISTALRTPVRRTSTSRCRASSAATWISGSPAPPDRSRTSRSCGSSGRYRSKM